MQTVENHNEEINRKIVYIKTKACNTFQDEEKKFDLKEEMEE